LRFLLTAVPGFFGVAAPLYGIGGLNWEPASGLPPLLGMGATGDEPLVVGICSFGAGGVTRVPGAYTRGVVGECGGRGARAGFLFAFF